MQTRGAYSFRLERVPLGAASPVKILRVIAVAARPNVFPFRTPFTEGTANTWNFNVVEIIRKPLFPTSVFVICWEQP